MDAKELIAKFVDTIRTDIINSMQANGKYVTGEFAQSMEVISDEKSSALWASIYITALEFGRKPTRPGAPTGNPTLYESIVAWASARGISEFETDDKGKKINVWRAITAHIHKYGYEGTPGILSIPLGDDNVNNRLSEIMTELADLQVKTFLDAVGG